VAVSVFHDNSLGWEKNAKLFVHSDTDPYVPLDQAKYVADNREAKMIVIPGQCHFNLEQSPELRSAMYY